MIMTAPGPLSSSLRFPNFTEFPDLSFLSIVIQELSTTYDVTGVAVLPNYGEVRMPSQRLGPRRWSPLRRADRIQVSRLTLASPLTLVIAALGIGGAPRVLKAYTDVLAAGLDARKRIQALEENRQLAPERVRAAQIHNALAEQKLRRVTAEADLIERARDEALGSDPLEMDPESEQGYETSRRASSLTASEFSQLLDEPIRRIITYGGGELEIGREWELEKESGINDPEIG